MPGFGKFCQFIEEYFLIDSISYNCSERLLFTSGHPNGCCAVWIPLFFTAAGLVLTAANYGCNLAAISNGKSVELTGAICSINVGSIECEEKSFRTGNIGLFSFQDVNTQACIPYSAVNLSDPYITSALVFSGLRWLFGIISFFWLLLSMCCPIRSIHKKVILFLTFFATVFQSLFFLFYGNEICKENGCYIGVGGFVAIGGNVAFLLAFASVLCITPLTPSWENHENEQVIRQVPTADSGDYEVSKAAVTGVVLGEEEPQKRV